METIKEILFTNWNFVRWVRLGLGIIVGILAIQMQDGLLGLLAAFFLFQSFTNSGCCAYNSCPVPKSTDNKPKELDEGL
jgi:hypothetical protein